MKKITALLVMGMFLLCSAGSVMAAGKGSKAEAQALATKAAAYIQQYGKEKAIAEFNNPKGAFVDRDLYVFAFDFNGTTKAMVVNPELIGTSMLNKKDPDGRTVIKDQMALANNGGGWYDFKWNNPATKEVKAKSSYVIKVADDLWIGCGAFL